jgi:hypothetical protein
MVCRIAYLLLDDAQQTEVRRLTAAYRRPDGGEIRYFTDGCIFPDEARAKARDGISGWTRFDEFNDWHFLNLPRDSHEVSIDDCGGNCVLHAIDFHAAALKNAATDQDKAEALFFLGHWVGDVHQPLHVSFADDLGGNSIKPIKGGFYQSGSLHSVWDSGIIFNGTGMRGWRIYADQLKDAITPVAESHWLTADSVEWARESFVVTTSPDVTYCRWNGDSCDSNGSSRTLTSTYQTQFQDEVEMRLQQAGVRLADLIRKNLQ